ncbi:MAG: class I SAM-dependent methyltransferase [Mycobacterium sp.]
MSGHETETLQRLRRENLDGLTGRVLELGAGTGSNFGFYPQGVTEVVALEPEPRLEPLAARAAAAAPVPITVSASTIEEFTDGDPFDAVVCSLVLCSIGDPDAVAAQLFTLCRPGGELRFLEHVASVGWRGTMQRMADATVWPRLIGNCHTHRDTVGAIRAAGFSVERVRHEWVLPRWAPLPVSEHVVGRAVRLA